MNTYRPPQINVSEEYLATVSEWLQEWVHKPSSMTFPQFCKQYGISYEYLKHFCYLSDNFRTVFEVCKSHLFSKWLDFGMQNTKLPKHQVVMLMRYMKYYDAHTWDLDKEMKATVAYAEGRGTSEGYMVEKYDRAQLDGTYKDHYQRNADKRGSTQETQ